MGYIIKYIGPLTITPSISLIGLSLFDVGADHACKFVNERMIDIEFYRGLNLPLTATSLQTDCEEKTVRVVNFKMDFENNYGSGV